MTIEAEIFAFKVLSTGHTGLMKALGGLDLRTPPGKKLVLEYQVF